MKRFLAICSILFMLLTPLFGGLSKKNAIVLTADLDVETNYQTWQDLDLSGYTSNKVGECLLYCTILSGDEVTPSESVLLKFKRKGDNVKPEEVYFRYGQELGVVKVITDDDGVIEWYSDYGWPAATKTVTIQITLMFVDD